MKVILGLLILACYSSCARPSGAAGILHAEQIPSPNGVECYAIIDGDGNVKGGSCK